jgi:glycosyltransferase involved in cell wall biosynthesis
MRQLGHAAAIVASSKATRNDLIVHLGIEPDRVHVVPLAVDHSVFQPRSVPLTFWNRYGLDPTTKYVLHVSSEEPRKNISTLLRAWQKVTQQLSNAVLLKVGASLYPSERAAMVHEIQARGLGTRIRVIDRVSESDLAQFYNISTAFAFPSVAEGFGFPALEAMASGTPVVCSDIAALHEVVGDAAIRVPAMDDDALAEALFGLLTDDVERAHLRQAALARATLFTWERTAAATHQVYEAMLRHC